MRRERVPRPEQTSLFQTVVEGPHWIDLAADARERAARLLGRLLREQHDRERQQRASARARKDEEQADG